MNIETSLLLSRHCLLNSGGCNLIFIGDVKHGFLESFRVEPSSKLLNESRSKLTFSTHSQDPIHISPGWMNSKEAQRAAARRKFTFLIIAHHHYSRITKTRSESFLIYRHVAIEAEDEGEEEHGDC